MKMLLRASRGTLLKDQTIPGFPHKFDLYIPNIPVVSFAMVPLHGGTGGKQFIAQSIGLTYAANPTIEQVNWQLLEFFKCMVIIPQGQHCDGTFDAETNPNSANTVSPQNPDGVATWTNWNMYSQAQDKEFLIALALWIANHFPNKARILAGHSNGGMMVHRMWLEASGYFNFYCSTSGPMPKYWDSQTIAPPSLKPFYARYSLGDTVLGIKDGRAGIGNHFWDTDWLQQPAQYSVAGYAWPDFSNFVSGWRSFQTQVGLMGGTFKQSDGVVTTAETGTITTWTYAGGDLKLDLLTAGDHGIVNQTKALRKYQFAQWMSWVLSTFVG